MVYLEIGKVLLELVPCNLCIVDVTLLLKKDIYHWVNSKKRSAKVSNNISEYYMCLNIPVSLEVLSDSKRAHTTPLKSHH